MRQWKLYRACQSQRPDQTSHQQKAIGLRGRLLLRARNWTGRQGPQRHRTHCALKAIRKAGQDCHRSRAPAKGSPDSVESIKNVLRHPCNDPPILDGISLHAFAQAAPRSSVEYLGRHHDQVLCIGSSDATRLVMRNVFADVVSFALPPRCAGCGEIVNADLQFCAACWQSLALLSGRGCERCGTPVPSSIAICAPCLQAPPDHDGVFAVVAYGTLARTIALKLKHGRKVGLAKLMAHLLLPRLPDEAGFPFPSPPTAGGFSDGVSINLR